MKTDMCGFKDGYAGEERFDERLLLLRFLQDLPRLLLVTVLGCLLFGGLYVLTKIVLAPPVSYEAKTSYLLTFTTEYVREGDYYVNDYTWNTYLGSDAFWEALRQRGGEAAGMSREDFLQMASMALESDYHIPVVTVQSTDPELARCLSEEIRDVLTGGFARTVEGVDAITVLQDVTVEEALRDVRPVRAFVLAAVLCCFFVCTAWLLRELGTDSIYLPATLRERYGLRSLGSAGSAEFSENLAAVLSGPEKTASGQVAVTSSAADCDPSAAAALIGGAVAVPSPVLAPESAQILRKAGIVLLAVPAGMHSGKPLERTLEFLKAQEIPVSGAFLWDADEELIRRYYRGAKGAGKGEA